jgi:hypothetical protein
MVKMFFSFYTFFEKIHLHYDTYEDKLFFGKKSHIFLSLQAGFLFLFLVLFKASKFRQGESDLPGVSGKTISKAADIERFRELDD